MSTKTILREGGKKVKTNKYVVHSINFDFQTKNPISFGFEIMDLINNRLVHHVNDEWDIEDQYECFWNRLNPIESSWYNRRTEIVKVIDVFPIEEFKQRYPKEWYEMDEKKNLIYRIEELKIKEEFKTTSN